MQIPLNSPARKAALLGAATLLAGGLIAFSAIAFCAAIFSQRPYLSSLERASWLQPGNAEYRYRVGLALAALQPQKAAPWFRGAVALNPHRALYWLSLAAAYQLQGDAGAQQDALDHAEQADPRNPDVAWDAAGLYVSLGEPEKALQQYRIVLANDPYRAQNALQICWRLQPDTQLLVRELPRNPDVYVSFLSLLLAKKDTEAATQAWSEIVDMNKPIPRQIVFDYVHYLLKRQDVHAASLVWKQSTGIAGLVDYQPSPENLVVNGDFSLEVLDGGFGWFYYKTPGVSLALDPTEFHSSHRSLAFEFEKAQIADAGVGQLIPVKPDQEYEFSSFYKTEDLQGAGGPRFTIQDAVTGAIYFTSDYLTDADFWKQASGVFKTGDAASLLTLHIQRDPPGEVIEGKLWIDGVRLVEKNVAEASQ